MTAERVTDMALALHIPLPRISADCRLHVGDGRKKRAKVQTALNLRDGEKVVVGTATIRNRALVIVLAVKLVK